MKDLILMVLTLFLFLACLLLFGAVGCTRPDCGTAPEEQYNYVSPILVNPQPQPFGTLMPQDMDNREMLAEYQYFMNAAAGGAVGGKVGAIFLDDPVAARVYCEARAQLLRKHMRRRNLIQ